MGSLGCPLCCQQDFESVGTLREHLIYYIYRPLQCGVCCQHLAGIQEFIHHLRCHMGEELSTAPKLPCSKPSLPPGGEFDSHNSPLPLATAVQDGGGTDSDAGIGTAHVSDDFSRCMKGSDTANQMLKLREWRLEKLGKNFSRHRASFGKSPGLLELSPASGRLHRSSPPASVRDSIRDRRPSSQNSFYTARSDVLSFGKDIDSVERCDSSATPLSVYGNVGSVELSDHSVCPQSVGKEVTEELGFHSPAPQISTSHGPHSHLSEQTTSCTTKQVNLVVPHVEGAQSPSIISGGEVMPKNMNFQDCIPPESNVSCGVDMSHQPRSAVSPLLYVPVTQEAASCNLQSLRNKIETSQGYNMCETNFSEPLNKSLVTDNSIVNSEQYESNNRLPLLETVNSSELSADACPQYHELQPVHLSREPRSCETASRLSDLWASCPSNGSSAVHMHVETSNKPQSKMSKDSYTLTDSHFSSIQDNISEKTNAFSYWLSNSGEGSCQPEVINTGEKMMRNVNSDDTNVHEDDTQRGVRNSSIFPDVENSSALQGSVYEDQAATEVGCEEPYHSLADTKPYLHKKFHHDQERKVLQSTGVDQVADVSQYINSFQSVLVRKLNGMLSSSIPMSSSICTTSMTKPDKDISQVGLEEPHQPQAKEQHTCEACHKTFKSLSTFQLHRKEHEKGENLCDKVDLYRKCPKDPCKRKRRRKEKFQCDQCSKVFPKAFNIDRHMREVHAVKKAFTCVQCNKAFSSKRHLQEHSGIHRGEKKHKCPKCSHQCYTASGLRTHIQEIHSSSEQRVHSCEECGEKFAKIYGLKRHIKRKHPKDTEQQLVCNICSKNFACQEDLNKHSKSHLDSGILKCDICNETFSTSWALQRHSKVHQHSQLFKCDICNYKFTRKDSLVSHSYIHSQKKLFSCHCGKRFVKKSQLKEHPLPSAS